VDKTEGHGRNVATVDETLQGLLRTQASLRVQKSIPRDRDASK